MVSSVLREQLPSQAAQSEASCRAPVQEADRLDGREAACASCHLERASGGLMSQNLPLFVWPDTTAALQRHPGKMVSGV